MPSKVYSAAVVGVEAFEVEIEVHAGWGNSDKIALVGLPDTAVKESKDREFLRHLQQRVAHHPRGGALSGTQVRRRIPALQDEGPTVLVAILRSGHQKDRL